MPAGARPLTPRQEAAARKYVETNSQVDAYRFAYDTSNMALSTIYPNASRLFANSKVQARVAELLEEKLRDVDVRATDIVREAWNIARDPDAPHASRVSALALLARRHPEFSDKHQVQTDVRVQALALVAGLTPEQRRALAEGVEEG